MSQPLHVIVVEDDPDLREELVIGLGALGFDCIGVADAPTLYRQLVLRRPDMILLDVGLPGEDGFSVAAHLRMTPGIGVVMLTARGALEDRVRGLDGGADAYLVKPVALEELASTLRSLARRLGPRLEEELASAWKLEAGGWVLREPGGRTVVLTATERTLVERLLSTPDRVVSRDELMASLTDKGQDYDPHRLDVLLSRLRRKLADAGFESPIQVVRGIGYLFKNA
ncbi:response regulator transcription factor [Chitinimonas sp.]|uniref:response regulator transcription factor n=1 Tax=Chitinimonas sp. TaxID=1934313 RepID=UPI0035AF9B9B